MSPEYIAGFFDGEGCVSSTLGRGYAQPRLIVAQKDPEVLYMIQRISGGQVRQLESGVYQLHIKGKQRVIRFIRLIYPYSIVKKEQLRVAYKMALLVGEPVTHAWRRRQYHVRLQELKKEAI